MSTSNPSAEFAETLTVEITDLARGGAGVARDETGRVIFVPLTAPGDRVRVRVVEKKKNYAQAELLEILTPSPQRQTPPCPVFGKCGGCLWQHLPYELQWKTKASGVRHALERVQVAPPQDWTELPAERIWEYRNRIQLRGFEREIGFFGRGSKNLVPVDGCKIARPEINAEWERTRDEGSRLAKPYKVEIEVLPSGQVRRAWNSPHAAMGFRQIHDEQNEKLRAWVANSLTEGGELLDLFGGSGNLSVPLAGKFERIQCVDVSAPVAPETGTPSNVTFHRSSVLSWLLRNARSGSRTGGGSSAIIDPPREGLHPNGDEIAAALEAIGLRELVAVGCDPDSWARDVSRLLRRGWKLERVAVLELFPQTPHVESIAKLTPPPRENVKL